MILTITLSCSILAYKLFGAVFNPFIYLCLWAIIRLVCRAVGYERLYDQLEPILPQHLLDRVTDKSRLSLGIIVVMGFHAERLEPAPHAFARSVFSDYFFMASTFGLFFFLIPMNWRNRGIDAYYEFLLRWRLP